MLRHQNTMHQRLFVPLRPNQFLKDLRRRFTCKLRTVEHRRDSQRRCQLVLVAMIVALKGLLGIIASALALTMNSDKLLQREISNMLLCDLELELWNQVAVR